MDYIRNFYAGYRDLLDNKSDPRVSEWFLMSSPLPTAAICITYAYCVKVCEKEFVSLSKKNFNLFKKINDFFSFWNLGPWSKTYGKQKTL
jgi:hypothetical protein